MIYFLIPVYNEKDNIFILYENLLSVFQKNEIADFTLIFIDDGSTDDSRELITKLQKTQKNIVLLSHYPNKGIKETFSKGFNYFLKVAKEGDVLLSMEADNTFDENIIPEMIKYIVSGDYDIVLASCYAKGGKIDSTNIIRVILSSVANFLVRARFGLWKYRTLSSFNRAYSYNCLFEAYQRCNLLTLNGFACMVEMLIKMKKMNFKIKEVPTTLKSYRRKGRSKMPVLKTIFEYLFLCCFADMDLKK